MNDTLVAGEDPALLFEAFLRFDFKEGRDGMMEASVELEPRLGNPLLRALMRVKAELLLEDADQLGSPDYEQRTDAQRGADAFLALVFRVTDPTRDRR